MLPEKEFQFVGEVFSRQMSPRLGGSLLLLVGFEQQGAFFGQGIFLYIQEEAFQTVF
ncbi:MAG: hypothetical protein IPJ40_01345 [Saprospirales bacterium]|nr:hypothetical protein [Saprospirales bacterium]